MSELNKIKHFKLLTPSKDSQFLEHIKQLKESQGVQQAQHFLQDRIVFSFVAYRTALDLDASIREIARETSLHAMTVKKSLNYLGHLVSRRGNQWFAEQPPDGWFIRVLDADHWSHTLAYVMLFVPRQGATFRKGSSNRRFGISHAVVYSQLVNRAKNDLIRGFTVRGFSKMLHGLSERTISTVIQDLQHLGMIRRHCADIELQPLTEVHLEMFDPKEKIERKSKQVTAPTAEEKPSITHDDGLHEYRQQCKKSLPPDQAQQCIEIAKKLGLDAIQFGCELENAEKRHKQNVIDGKVGRPDLGRYFAKILQSRLDALDSRQRELLASIQADEYRNSPEGMQVEADRLEKISADPSNPKHHVDVKSIINRVSFHVDKYQNGLTSEWMIKKVHGHCHKYVHAKEQDIQKAVEETGNLADRILKEALTSLNSYYRQESRATRDQFQIAVDEAIQKLGDMVPLFEKVSG